MRVRPDAVLARNVLADRDHGAPLREARAELAVLVQPFAEPVEAFGDGLTLGQCERLCSRVHFDPGDDSLRPEQLREGGSVGRALAERLVEEDDAADVLLSAFGREEEVAVSAPRLFVRLDTDRVEAFLDRAAALVRREDSLTVRDDRLGGLLQLLNVHVWALLVFFREEVSPKIINPEGHRCGGRPSFCTGPW